MLEFTEVATPTTLGTTRYSFMHREVRTNARIQRMRRTVTAKLKDGGGRGILDINRYVST